MRQPEDILQRIVETKRAEVVALRRSLSALRDRAEDAPPAKDFIGSLQGGNGVAIIAEIKRRSPSKGEIRADFDPVICAKMYEEAGPRRSRC